MVLMMPKAAASTATAAMSCSVMLTVPTMERTDLSICLSETTPRLDRFLDLLDVAIGQGQVVDLDRNVGDPVPRLEEPLGNRQGKKQGEVVPAAGFLRAPR